MKQRFLFILACLLCLPAPSALTATAAQIPPAASPDGQRYLFIMDLSEDMESLKEVNETTLYELIISGVFGQMRTGDTYGVWTFNKETFAGQFPMQVWDRRKANQLAVIASAFVSGRNYEKTSDVKQMIEQLSTVMHTVRNVTVFIISDGSSAMRGTPFDKAINADYKKRRRERSGAKLPFVTTLVARDGVIVKHTVTIGSQPVELPQRPPPQSAEVKVAPENKPANQTAPPAAPRVVVKPESKPASVPPTPSRPKVVQIVTKSNSLDVATNSAPPNPAEIASSSTSPARTNDASSPPVVTPAPQPPPSAPAIAVQQDVVPATTAKVSTAEEALAALLPAPLAVAARELAVEPPSPKPAPPVPIEAVMIPVSPSQAAGWMLAFGAALLAMATLLLMIVFRRLRPTHGSSLITQSMERR